MTDKPQPIATAPRDGRVVFVSDGATMKRAFFIRTCRGETWHTVAPESAAHLVQPLGFEPTHWSDNAEAFLTDDPWPEDEPA